MAELLTQAQVAEHLDLDVRQIRNLQKQGLPSSTRKVKGKDQRVYPWPAALHWYLKFKVEAAKGGESAKELQAEQLAKLRAERMLAEHKLAREQAAVATLDYFERQWDAVLLRVRAQMLNLAAKWAPQIVGMRTIGEAQAALEPAVEEAMRMLATIGEDPDIDAGDDEEDDDRDASESAS